VVLSKLEINVASGEIVTVTPNDGTLPLGFDLDASGTNE